MSVITRIAEESTSSYVTTFLGSGSYLALAAGFLVIVAGIITVIKRYVATANLSKSGTMKAGTIAHYEPSGLRGSFALNEQTINEEVGYGSAGVYALGHKRGSTFIIQRIDRSDTDVHAGLKGYIGKYDQFKFEYADSPQAAFTKECELYHAFGGLERRIPHPDPAGMAYHCPMCTVLDSQPSSKSVVATTEKRFCAECGMELPADVGFCTRCGKAVS